VTVVGHQFLTVIILSHWPSISV